MKREILEQLLAARANRQGVALITNLDTGEQRIVPRSQAAQDPLAEKLDEAFRFDQSGRHDGQFVNIHNPPLRLVIIGAVHIAQSVIPIAQQLGYDVTVIDPREGLRHRRALPRHRAPCRMAGRDHSADRAGRAHGADRAHP